MKHFIITLLLFVTGTVLGQKENQIQKSDFKLESDGRWRITEKVYNLKNGDNKLSEVVTTIGCSNDLFSTLDVDKLNKMILFGNEKSKNYVKNKYTYSSRIIKLSSIPKANTWNMTIEFTYQNDYGVLKDGLNNLTFNENGEFIELKTFL